MYTVPVVNCTSRDSCVECIDYYTSNPLCGWCTLEHKCSRQSQCQSSHLAERYIKEREQCITVSDIHPRQITVGNSNTVSTRRRAVDSTHVVGHCYTVISALDSNKKIEQQFDQMFVCVCVCVCLFVFLIFNKHSSA